MSKKLIQEIAIYGVGDFVFKLISFAIFPIYAHAFSVADFGRLELVATLTGLIGTIIGLGLNSGMQRFYWDRKTYPRSDWVVSSGLWVLIVSSLLITFLSLIVLYFFRDTIVQVYQILWGYLLLSLLTNIPTQIIQYCLDVLRTTFAPWKFIALSGIKNILSIVICLWLVIGNQQGLMGAFKGNFIALFLVTPIALWLIKKEICFKLNKPICADLIRFGYPLVFVGLAYWFFGSMDRWLLGTLAGAEQVGLFSIAYKFAYIIIFVHLAFGQAWAPFALRLYAESPDYRQTIAKIASLWFFLLAVVGTIITLFSREILYLFTPEQYWRADSILGFLVMGAVLHGTTQITMLGISLEKKTHLFSRSAWIIAALNFLLNVILIPYYGALGAAIAIFISYATISSMYLYWSQKIHPFPLEKMKLSFSCVSIFISLVLSLILNCLGWQEWFILVKILFISFLVYGAFRYNIISVNLIKSLNWRQKTQ